jgi:hypothetical protein
MKRPSFQFYPADWRKDAALQSCSLPAQGLWINLLCIAHECEPYGRLMVNGRPMTAAQIGRLVGVAARDAERLLAELADAGVSSTDEQGAIYSRRMVRDEDLRNRRGDGGKLGAEHGAKGGSHGAKGGRPRKQQGPPENPPSDDSRGVFEPPKEPPPSSSSSSSSSPPTSEEEKTGHTPMPATAAARVVLAMKKAGISDVNPGHPELLALIAAGAVEAEFIGAATAAVDKRRGFAYALGVIKGQREDAARMASSMPQGAMPPAHHAGLHAERPASSDRRARQLEGAAVLTGAWPS